jgi:hypothetical protein
MPGVTEGPLLWPPQQHPLAHIDDELHGMGAMRLQSPEPSHVPMPPLHGVPMGAKSCMQ